MSASPKNISPATLAMMLQSGESSQQPLILDTRATTLFALRHMKNAISISFPKMLLKRLQKTPPSSVNLEEYVVCDKESLARRHSGCPVVVCDDLGTLEDQATMTVLNVLYAESIDPYYLEGS